MKRFIFICATVLMGFPVLATIRTVSNNPAIPAQFSDATLAIQASAVGDTLYFHGSAVSYGDRTLTKRLVLVGTGWAPSKQMGLTVYFDNISFGNNSGNSVLHGIRTGAVNPSPAGISSAVNGLKFYNCEFNSLYLYLNNGIGMNNWQFINCYFSYPWQNQLSSSAPATNFLFQNCWFSGSFGASNLTAIFNHCNFISGAFSGYDLGGQQNAIFNSCLFSGTSPSNASACTFNNCLSYNCNAPQLIYGSNFGSNNLENVDPAVIPGQSLNTNFQPFSPAINAGVNGTDIGIQGGNGLWTRTGEPNGFPQIEYFYNSGGVQQGGTVNTNLEVRKARQD